MSMQFKNRAVSRNHSSRAYASGLALVAALVAVPGHAQEIGQPGAQEGAAPGEEADSRNGAEIVVTAQKREERLLDVPISVAVVNTEALTATGQTRLEDYYTQVPGLSYASTGDGNKPFISIRGVATGGLTSPTVGIVIDEVPYGLTVAPNISPTPPDVDPGDLASIEVLKGPQGTLYGAASLGGLVKYVTIDPSTERFSGRVVVGAEGVKYGDDLGYTVRGAVNIPLGETLAVRASAFKLRSPGFIDNLTTGEKDANARDSKGARVSALWRPSDSFRLKLNAIFQDSIRQSSSDEDIDFRPGAPKQQGIVGADYYGRKTMAFSAIMNADAGPFEFTSVTGYNDDKIRFGVDTSRALAGFETPPDGSALTEIQRIKKFSQEVRVGVSLGESLQWSLGTIYVNEDISDNYDFAGVDRVTGQRTGRGAFNISPGPFLVSSSKVKYSEFSLFSNLTINLTDRFDVQLGGRYSDSRSVFESTVSGSFLVDLIYGANPNVVPQTKAKADAFTYLLTPRFRISKDLMVYGRIASSFRPPSPNATACGVPGLPCQVDPDKTQSYEIGAKGSVFDGGLTFDVSAYHIDWKDIQLETTSDVGGLTFFYQENAGDARSRGVELTLTAKPWSGMTMSGWIAHNDIKLVRVDPSVVSGVEGDRLPFSSPWSGSFSMKQEFELAPEVTGNLGGSIAYVDDRFGRLRAPGVTRAIFPHYTRVDLQAGLDYRNWSLNLYINNLTNKRGMLRGGPDAYAGLTDLAVYTQPRTIGFTLGVDF